MQSNLAVLLRSDPAALWDALYAHGASETDVAALRGDPLLLAWVAKKQPVLTAGTKFTLPSKVEQQRHVEEVRRHPEQFADVLEPAKSAVHVWRRRFGSTGSGVVTTQAALHAAAGPSATAKPRASRESTPAERTLQAKINDVAAKVRDPANQLPRLASGQGIIIRHDDANAIAMYRIESVDADGVTLAKVDPNRRDDSKAADLVELPDGRRRLTLAALSKRLNDPKLGWEVHQQADLRAERVLAVAEGLFAELLQLQAKLAALRIEGDIGSQSFLIRSELVRRRAELVGEEAVLVAHMQAWLHERDMRPTRLVLSTEAFGEAPQRGPIARIEAALAAIDAAVQSLDNGQTLTPGSVDLHADPVLALVATANGKSLGSVREEMAIRQRFLQEAADHGRLDEGWAAYHTAVRPYLTLKADAGDSIHFLANGKPSLTQAINHAINNRKLGRGQLVLSAAELEALRDQVRANWETVLRADDYLTAGGGLYPEKWKPVFDAKRFDAEVARLRKAESSAAHREVQQGVKLHELNLLAAKIYAAEHALSKVAKDKLAGFLGELDSYQFLAMSVVGGAAGSITKAAMPKVASMLAAGSLSPRAASILMTSAEWGLKGGLFQVGMNAYHAGVGQQDAVDWSPAGFARSVAMMAVGDVLGKAHVKRLGKLDQVDNARRLVGQSPALLRRAGEGARYFVSEVGAFSALGVCEALIREGKLDNAWQIVEGNIQFMLAMRMWRGVETGALRAARATYVKEPTAANLQRVVKEFETVVGKAEGTKDTLSGAAARQNPIPSGGKAAAVVGPEGQKVERRVDAKEGEVNAPDVAKDPAVELFLSYRATKSWSEMIDFAKTLPEPLAKAPLVREQLALALNRAGRGEEAERILLDLIGERGPKSETYGILGRIYKDRFEVAAKNDDSPAAGRWLEKSIDAYLKGFEADPQDAYPGINAVTLMELTQPADPRRAQILPVVQGAVERKITTSAPGYWDVATVLELAVLAKDQGKAVQALGAALRAAHEPWEAETTARNLRLIREARERRNESVVWAEQIESQLQARAGI